MAAQQAITVDSVIRIYDHSVDRLGWAFFLRVAHVVILK